MNIRFSALFMITIFSFIIGTANVPHDAKRDPANIRNTIEDRVDDFAYDLNDLENRQGFLEKTLSTFCENYKKDKKHLEEKTSAINTKTNALEADLRKTNEESKRLKNDFDTTKTYLNTNVKKQDQQIMAFTTAIGEEANNTKERLERVEDRVDDMSKKFIRFGHQNSNDQMSVKTALLHSINRLVFIQSTMLTIPLVYGIYKVFSKEITKYFAPVDTSSPYVKLKNFGKTAFSFCFGAAAYGLVNSAIFKGIIWAVRDADFSSSPLGLMS